MAKRKNRGIIAGLATGITVTALGIILFGAVSRHEEKDPLLIISEERVPLSMAEEKEEAGYSLDIDGTEIKMDAPVLPIIAKLGTPLHYSEAEDGSGRDRTYYYDGFEIATYTSGEVEKVGAVFLLDEDILTSEGVNIGMTRGDMEEVYGTDYVEADDLCSYQKDGMGLSFLLKDDQIVYIQCISSKYL